MAWTYASSASRRRSCTASVRPRPNRLNSFGGGTGTAGSAASCCSRCASLEMSQQLLALNRIAFSLDDLAQHAVSRRNHFQHHLVGFDIHQQLVALDGITFILVPGCYRAVSH